MAERRPIRRRSAAVATALAALAVTLGAGAGPAMATPSSATRPRSAAASETATTAARQTETVTQTATMTTTTTATTSATTSTEASHPRQKTVRTPPAPAPTPRAAAPVTRLGGWLSPYSAFPHRSLVLAAPTGSTLNVARLDVTENRRAVTAPTLDALTNPARGDFGVMLALQSGGVPPASLASEMSAARALAADRPAGLGLGVETFAAAPTVLSPVTVDGAALKRALAADPMPASGAAITSAGTQALHELRASRDALGVVVIVADGVGLGAGQTRIAAAAAAAHVPVVTIGLQDGRATNASLDALRRWAPGAFMLSVPSELATTVVGAVTTIADDFSVAHYDSGAPAGRPVTVAVHAAGIPGGFTTTYRAPGSPAPVRRHVSRPRLTLAAAAVPAMERSNALSATPGFAAVTATPAAAPAAPAAAAAPIGFWHSETAVLVVALLSALLVGLMVVFLLRRPDGHAVRNRVGSYMPTELQDDAQGGQHGDEARRSGLFGALQRGTWWPGFVEAVEISRNPKTPGFLMKRAAVISVLAAVVLAFITRIWALGLLPLLAFPFVERWWVMRQATKQRLKFSDTLPSYMQDIASAIRVGRSLVSAIAIVADSAEEPTRSELERAVTDEALGRPLEESLSAVGTRMHSGDMDQFALIAELNRRSGSNVAEALDRVSEGARDRADLRREMRALTAQSKMSSSVLTGMPFVLLLGLSVIAPAYAQPLFHTMWGWISLIFAVVLIGIGWKVMKKITNVGV